MYFWAKLILVTTLTVFYLAYFVEMYRHLTYPLKSLGYMSRQKKIHRLILFFAGVVATIFLAYIIRQFVLPRPYFDLIVISLQAIFIIPFFGALFTDRLLHAWRKKRLPHAISMLNIFATAAIALATNLLILFGSMQTIEKTTYILEVATDIIAVCFVITLGVLGIGYINSRKK